MKEKLVALFNKVRSWFVGAEKTETYTPEDNSMFKYNLRANCVTEAEASKETGMYKKLKEKVSAMLVGVRNVWNKVVEKVKEKLADIWYDSTFVVLRNELYNNLWGTWLRRVVVGALVGMFFALWYYVPVLFYMAMFTIGTYAIFGAIAVVGMAVVKSFAKVAAADELKLIKEDIADVAMANAEANVQTAEKRAKAKAAAMAAAAYEEVVERKALAEIRRRISELKAAGDEEGLRRLMLPEVTL